MKNNEDFDIKKFTTPDTSFAPVYVWVWNDVCTREIIDAQIKEMQNLGIRAFYILPEPKNFRRDSMPTSLTPEYLTPEYFELCAYAVEKGEKAGMLCWIYDEGGWPSGGACGNVLKDHPEYAKETLEYYERYFSAGDTYKKTTPNTVGAFIDDIIFVEEGYVFLKDTVVTEYVTEKNIYSNADYPDLLKREATQYFIEITHKKYASLMKNSFGKSVTAVFTDEPKAPCGAFNKELSEKYEAVYGESIIPYLPLIAEKVAPTRENVHVLYRWYDLCSRTFCENYLLICKKWANDNGLAFTGHMDMDHNPLGCVCGGGNFNLMRALRCFDIPGVDIIWRQLYPENKTTNKNDMNGYNGFFPRYASSAAAQNGTKFAMSEIFGVAGPGLTYDIMRYTVGYQAVRGINVFNLFNFPLGRKGQLLAQELPVFTENQPYYENLSQFNRYIERLSYIVSLGERVCETGLYYPVNDFQGGMKAENVAEQFDTLGRRLEDLTVDFDIVDDDVIQCSKGTDNGCISVGRASYRRIIIPKDAYIPTETQKALSSFIENGGKVSYTLSDLLPVIQIEGDGLRAMHRKTENTQIFCLFREKGDKGEYIIHLPTLNGYLLDLMTGTPKRFETENGVLNLSLEIGETVVILLTDEKLNAKSQKVFKNKFDISDNFTFFKENELIFNENGFDRNKCPDKAVPVNLGDWSYLIGNAYSGSGVYETTFTLPDGKTGKKGELDLGNVHFTAKAFLNGKCLGTALAPPYRFEIPEGFLEKNNKLRIIVTNTSANRYVHTDYFGKWSIKELSPYFEAELNYAKDFMSGGLYGPVSLYTDET